MGLPDANPVISQLDTLTEASKPSSKKRVSDREWNQFFDQFCQHFVRATRDDRIDLLVSLEDRDVVQLQFVKYLDGLARKAADHTARDRQVSGSEMLEQAIVADVIIDGRGDPQDLLRIHESILDTAEKLRFEIGVFLEQYEISADDYVRRAQQHFKRQNRALAIRTLGRAIQLDPQIKKNDRIVELASELTWEAPYSAIMILEDPFLRSRFIDEMGQSKRTSLDEEKNAHQADKTSPSLIKRLISGRR